MNPSAREVLRLTHVEWQQVARICSRQVCCPCRGRLAWQGQGKGLSSKRGTLAEAEVWEIPLAELPGIWGGDLTPKNSYQTQSSGQSWSRTKWDLGLTANVKLVLLSPTSPMSWLVPEAPVILALKEGREWPWKSSRSETGLWVLGMSLVNQMTLGRTLCLSGLPREMDEIMSKAPSNSKSWNN